MGPNERWDQARGCLDKAVRWPTLLACFLALAWVLWSVLA